MTVCPCGTPVPDTGASLDYCSEQCQRRYMGLGHDPMPTPARPEWRMGQTGCRCATSDFAGPEVCTCPAPESTPRPQWPDPPPGFARGYVAAGQAITEGQIQEATEHIAENVHRNPGMIRRILNATRRNT